MIFEKPKKKLVSLETASIFIISASYILYIVYIYYAVILNSNSKYTFLDFLNGLSQISTAAAFIVMAFQYRNSQHIKRQDAIFNAAQSLIQKIIQCVNQLDCSTSINIKNIDDTMRLIANFTVSLDELYKSKDEDINKSILRIQWQDMYISNLIPKFKSLDFIQLLKNETQLPPLDLDDLNRILNHNSNRILFKDYFRYKVILENPFVSNVFTMHGKFQHLNLFIYYYFNSANTNDYLYGVMNQYSIYEHAPILALTNPSREFIGDVRQPA